jgi:hypothetical protein
VHYFTIVVFPSTKTNINEHNKCPNGGPFVSPHPSTHHVQKRHQVATPHQFELQQRATTTTIIDLGHPAVKRHFCQLIKASKARNTGR